MYRLFKQKHEEVYRYYPDFTREGGELLIEGKDIEEQYLND